jgi:hypothetical protein
VQGILADVNVLGLVHYLAQLMQAGPWAEFWQALGLILRRFEDVGLAATASDLDVWQRCQAEGLILITDNRNADAADSLEAVIRQYNTPQSLPVFTIADLDKFRTSRDYAERVVAKLYEYLLDIDAVRGSGRLYLP